MRGHGVALLAGVLLPSVAGCALGPPAREDDGAPRPQAASLHKGWGPEQFEADRRCNAGEKPACSQLGRFLIVSAVDGDDVRRGYVLLEAACNDGDRAACTALGERLAIYDESRERGRQLLIAACQQRWAEACTLYGNVIQGRDFRSPEAGRWYLMGCDLGDANGCERYGWAGFHGHQQAMAVDGFGKACKLGSRPNCHMLAKILAGDPATRAEAARLFEENCNQGYAGSCTGGAVVLAPLVTPLRDCRRAAPLAEKTCRSREADACAVSDACKLGEAGEREAALARLRAACDRKVGLACLYWADVEVAASGDSPRVRAAYTVACRGNSAAIGAACPRLAALELTTAGSAAEARGPLALLTRACDASLGEACCLLAGATQAGKWVPPDPARVAALRAKACTLGESRCCGAGATRAAGPAPDGGRCPDQVDDEYAKSVKKPQRPRSSQS